MSETVNTSVIAPKAASQIFDFFKWNFREIGPADTNFDCIFLEEHSSLKKRAMSLNNTHIQLMQFFSMRILTSIKIFILMLILKVTVIAQFH
ncbi:TPA: hypothetical protein VAM19_001239 [Acinetobacter baumannii]|nr:hypothetical protein [Acinetobacter baumannii]